MKLKFTIIILAALASILPSAFGADTAEKKTNAPSLEDIIFDPAAFIKTLPKRALVFSPSQDNQKQVKAGIKALGPVPDVEFFNLPAESDVPVIKDQAEPKTPKGFSGHGEASLLVMIDASGKVAAIYCYHASHKAFAINAAAAVARWRFSPAKIQKTPVAVLFATTINFDSD